MGLPVRELQRTSALTQISSRRTLWFVFSIVLGANGSAWAQFDTSIPPDATERFAFDAADTDDDGYIDEAELARDAAVGFSSLDKDRDERLTPQELGSHDAAMFAAVDGNGDGLLTFKEVMTNKLRGLDSGDKDNDGQLSFDEMESEVKAEIEEKAQ